VRRLIVVGLFLFAAPLVSAQNPGTRTQTKPSVTKAPVTLRPQPGSARLPLSTVPLLFGMKRAEVARVLEPLHLQPKFLGREDGIALAQDPAAGTSVPFGSVVVVTLGLMPRLVLTGPAAPAYAGSELTVSVGFVPPLPAGPEAIYHFTWGDGSPTESTGKTAVTHRFADAGTHLVSAIWSLADNVKIGSARVVVDVLPPPTPPSDTAQTSVPLLFGMNRVQVSRALEPLHLRTAFSGIENGIVVDQKPPGGTRVPYGSTVAVTFGQLPRLILSASPAPATTVGDLWLTASFEPPLPARTPVSYRYAFGDDTFMGPTADAAVWHRFSDVSTRVVSVNATINDRVKLEGRISVEVVAPPSSDTAQTATPSDTSTTTTQTATTSDTSTTTTAITVDTGTMTSTIQTGPGTSDTTPTTVDTTPTAITSTTETSGSVPTPGTSSNPLVWIGAAAVVLLLVVTFLLARVLRALNRKPSEPQVQAKSPVAFNGGVRAIEYEIEHPELIRRGPAVGLRGGIRAEEGDDV
jgi:hypothetical protein